MCADTNKQGVSALTWQVPEMKGVLTFDYLLLPRWCVCSLFIIIKTVLIESMLAHSLQISPLPNIFYQCAQREGGTQCSTLLFTAGNCA